jgi:hypothetical protein
MMDAHEWPEAHRKRFREDDYADISVGGTLGFTEHRSKRLQSLPLRTSPNSKRWAEPPNFPPSNPSFAAPAAPRTITPGDSDSEEVAAALQQHAWADEPELLSHNQTSSMMPELADGDMDMMDTSDQTPASMQDQGQSHSEPLPGAAGRMPTPIHCSFAAQVRGSTVMDHESVPRSLDGPAAAAQVMADWNMVQNRRLPSPISESGGEDGSLGSPQMILDSSGHSMGHLSHLTHQHPLLSTLPARSSSAAEMRHGVSPEREGTPGAESPNGNAMDVESPATPSPRKGHVRSKHTVNSWTALEPGMKRSFSIGYRADCEKCRMKVPGHFNHIIIS